MSNQITLQEHLARARAKIKGENMRRTKEQCRRAQKASVAARIRNSKTIAGMHGGFEVLSEG